MNTENDTLDRRPRVYDYKLWVAMGIAWEPEATWLSANAEVRDGRNKQLRAFMRNNPKFKIRVYAALGNRPFPRVGDRDTNTTSAAAAKDKFSWAAPGTRTEG